MRVVGSTFLVGGGRWTFLMGGWGSVGLSGVIFWWVWVYGHFLWMSGGEWSYVFGG